MKVSRKKAATPDGLSTFKTDDAPIRQPWVTGQEIVLLVVIAVIWIFLAIATPSFLSASSLQPLFTRLAPTGIMAVGMTFVIITAGIDISVGAMIMVSAVTVAKMLVAFSIPAPLAILVSIVVGLILGCLNGVLIAYGRLHPIIVTFGTMNLFKFIGYRIFDSQTVNGIPGTLDFLGQGPPGRTLGVPNALVIMIIIVALAAWYLRAFPGGRHLYAIGGDPAAAELAGINVRLKTFMTYALMGALVGLAATMVLAGGTSTLDQSVGSGQELVVIAAVVIGGTSTLGGRGSVLGSVLGALLVQTVRSGVTQLGLQSQLANLFVGIFIIVAVGADIFRENRRKANE